MSDCTGIFHETNCDCDDSDAAERTLMEVRLELQKAKRALKMHMDWIGPPPIDRHSFDSLREDAWKLGLECLGGWKR